MNMQEVLRMSEIYLELREQMINLTDDLLKYHLSVKGSSPHTYEESTDLMYSGMQELVKSEGKVIFSIEHGMDKMTLDYLSLKLDEIREARLNMHKMFVNKDIVDTYMFIDSKGMHIYSVQR